MKKKIYFEYLYLVVLGILSSLSLPPYNFLFINFATFSLFFIYIFHKKKSSSRNNKFLYGWFFGFGYFLSNLYWITISLSFDINFKHLIPIVLFLIPAFLAIFYGIFTFFFFLIKIKKPLSNLLLFSLLFGFIEFLRGHFLTGFPWNLIAYSFSNNIEILQILSSVGTYAFNIWCITLFTSPAIFVLRENKKEIIVCIFLLLSPLALYISGYSKIKFFQSLSLIQNDYVIRVIGSNIALERFYGNFDTKSVINELIEISEPELDSKTFFLWPEGIIPNINQLEFQEFKNLFYKKFNKNHLLGIGINAFEKKNKEDRFFNSFSIYDHQLNLINTYNKINLVPFGEFLPFEKVLGKLGLKSLTNNYQSFSKGEKRNILRISKNEFDITILPLICYEIIYSGRIFDDPSFEYLINVSEDGWFGKSIGPDQHFAHSVFRAIESGKYLFRSANNGIAAIIDPMGLVEKKIPLEKTGYIDFSEKRLPETTLFSLHGNKMFLIIILLYIFLIFSFNRIS
ncbi:apolipoprotein N-acyltransferase [Candidatus Pelagibacter communis]|uniref:apolipoprotein N-acyltransferase n=1 Tax=Pelagibacter ubique TaxID=198252 RepID=UPI0009E4C03C|nr:apolipoprotein N-acyltransferase [Candidatus Pelagibacter ubique]